MSNFFKITYSWEKRSEPLPFADADYVDATALFIAIEHFLAIYQGQFVVQVDNLNLHFDLRPDLSTIFEEIPDVLEKLKAKTESPVELYFFEQGTDLAFLLERQKNMITIRFRKGFSVGKEFEELPDTTFSLPADVFLGEWIRFALALLDALTALQPKLVKEESYQDYRTCLCRLSKND